MLTELQYPTCEEETIMPWKDGFFKRNSSLKWPMWGAFIIAGLIALALTFGPDEVREFAHDVAEKAGLVNPEVLPEPTPEPGS